MKKAFSFVLAVLLLTTYASAAGFWVPEFPGGAALGMSMAFAGQADDLSALYFNPAGITQLNGTILSIQATAIIYSVEFNRYSSDIAETAKGPAFVPYIAMTHDFGSERWNFGFAFYSVFGLNFVYPNAGQQRYLVQEVDLMAPTFNPKMAYAVNDRLSVALGLKASKLSIQLDKAFDTGYGIREHDINTSMSGSAVSYGYDLSLLYRINDRVRIGLVYDSKISYSADNVELDVQYPAILPLEDKIISGKADMSLPASLRLGVYFKPFDKFAFNIDINWMNWKEWDEIIVNIDEPVVPGTSQEIILKRYWNDSFAYRMGGEYYYSDDLTLRGGISYDAKAADDEWLEPGVPDTNKFNIALGLGYKINNLQLDLAVLYFFCETREIRTSQQQPSADGDYSSDFVFVGLGIEYRF